MISRLWLRGADNSGRPLAPATGAAMSVATSAALIEAAGQPGDDRAFQASTLAAAGPTKPRADGRSSG